MLTPTDAQAHALREITRKVRAMLDERAATVPPGDPARPSRYWSDFCDAFRYMLDLSPESLAGLRTHTYHLTGDNYQTYYFGDRSAFLAYWGPWLSAEGLPPAHVLAEPDDGIGHRLDSGRFVSQDVARFQRCVATLSRNGLLDPPPTGGPTRVIEIGGGYGGLALHLSRILGEVRYAIVDLPEVLLFSAAYLAMQAPGRSIYLHDPAAPADLGDLDRFDFVLLPDYRLDALASSRFDLAINVASMQEMRPEQVTRYLDFLATTCRGTFYSCNRDRQNRNEELAGLFALLRTRFDLTEVPPLPRPPETWKDRTRRALRRLARPLGLVGPDGAGADPFPFVEHLGRARRA